MTNTTAALKERPAETNSVDTLIAEAPGVYPYPRWWSSVERGSLFVLSSAVLVLVIYFFASGNDGAMGILIAGLLGVRPLPPSGSPQEQILTWPWPQGALGFLSNGLSIILLILDKYGPKGYWIWNCLWDIITAACCVGGFAVAIEDRNAEKNPLYPRPPSPQATKDALMCLCLITAIGHFAANVAGFYGIHLVNKRGRVPGAAEHDDLDV